MIIRNGFVSNSSSTSFIITNLTSEKKDIVDFVKENPEIMGEWIHEYGNEWMFEKHEEYTQEKLIESAKNNNITFKPNEEKGCIFGDEQGTLIGQVFDYMLRNEQESKSFKVRFDQYLR